MNNDKRILIVLFTGHVGSTWLTSLIASHPDICQIGFEPVDDLTEMGIPAKQYFEQIFKGDSADSFPINIADSFNKTTKSAADTPDSDWGINHKKCVHLIFKARINLTLQQDFFIDYLPNINPIIIVLRRKNKIKNAISQFKRTQLQISHLENIDQTKHKQKPVVVDPSYILKQAILFTIRELRLKYYISYLYQEYGISSTEIFYEDILYDESRELIIDKIFTSLGLPSSNLNSRYQKVTSDLLSDAIANFSELADLISNTEFSPYLLGDTYDIVNAIYFNELKFSPAEHDSEISYLKGLCNTPNNNK